MVAKDLKEIAAYLRELGIASPEICHAITVNPAKGVMGMMCGNERSFGADKVHYKFNILKRAGSDVYEVETYLARLLRIPEITHGVYNGVDTAELEERLQNFKWDRDTILSSEGETMPQMYVDIAMLSEYSPEARRVAGILALKYWADTPMENMVDIPAIRKEFEQVMRFEINKQLTDVDAVQAYNLMCGRAVMQFLQKDGEQPEVKWLSIKEGNLVKYDDFDVTEALRSVPFSRKLDNETGPEMILELLAGHAVPIEIVINGKVLRVDLVADPANGKLALYDQQQQRIELLQQKPAKEQAEKKQQSAKRTPRKGKGL